MNDKQIEKRLAANTKYWADRMAENQQKISAKNEKIINKQLRKYYRDAQEEVIDSFIRTYEKLLLAVKDGDNITPADLYNLDRYWQLQGQLKQQLQELGDKQGVLYSKKFMEQYYDIYNSISIPSAVAFSTINDEAVAQMINEIWVADGKNWSSRIWDNTNKLQQRLNDNLIDCVLTGKSTNRLKEILQEDFNVSYKQADSLVRTELAHIQTTAAQHRYKDYGIKQVQVWADEDERRCPVCGKLHEKKYNIYDTMPVPVHPRCRCCIVPVVEDIEEKKKESIYKNEKALNKNGQEIEFDDKLDSDKWKKNKEMIIRLSNEYETNLVSVSIGAENAAGTVDMGGNMKLSSSKISTTIHEFAHTIAMENMSKWGLQDNTQFWKDIRKVRTAYRKAVRDDTYKRISHYADADRKIDEFMAEAFTHAKLAELGYEIPREYGSDFTYSYQVLEIIDRYFKKPI